MKAILRKFAGFDIANITSKDVVEYQKFRVSSRCAPQTINGETAILLQVLKWCAKKRLLERIPEVETIPLPIIRVDIPTQDEVRKIMDALPPLTSLLVRFLAETGVRKGEAFALEWSDLETANNVVSIRRKKFFTPKTQHSDRDIPITQSLMDALQEAQRKASAKALVAGSEPSAFVFPGKNGKKRVDFRKALATAIAVADVRRRGDLMHITPHQFRKAMATWMHIAGVSDAGLQPRLGHARGSRITSKTYVTITTENMRAQLIDLGGNPA